MRNLFFILFLLPIISYSQTNSEFNLQHSIEFDEKKHECIAENYCFFLDLNTNAFSVTLYYSFGRNGNKQSLETMDISDFQYGSTLSSFKNETNNSYIVIWKRESEFAPLFYVYYIKEGILMKIGEWGITEPCDTCDTGDYLIENIRIYQKSYEIEFLFLKETRFAVFKENFDYEDFGTYKAGNLVVSFNIVDEALKVINSVWQKTFNNLVIN